MTDQTVTATISNARLGKIFTASSTDGTWAGTLKDTLSSQQIGILMPGVPITHVQTQYAGGLTAWRIQNSATLTFQRYGFGVKDGLACYESARITPYNINPNDIVSVYSQPPLAWGTNVLAWVVTSKGVELFEANGVLDATSTPMLTVVNDQSLGDSMFNSTLASIHVQAQDGAVVDSIELIDASGGTVLTIAGGVRGEAGSMSNLYNLKADGLAVPIGKGWSLKVTTTA